LKYCFVSEISPIELNMTCLFPLCLSSNIMFYISTGEIENLFEI
jgi:hypothetical protein